MATEVLIPKLGMTMTEGKVAEWLVPDGATVQHGDIVYRLETEKIEFQVEAEAAGVVRHLVRKGTVLPPGSVVAYILAPGEELPAGALVPTPIAEAASGGPAQVGGGGIPLRAAGERPFASPIARRLAKEAGLDVGAIVGSGPGGRVTEADVLAERSRPRPVRAGPALARPSGPAPGAALAEPVPASPIARRLAAELGVDLARVRGTGPGGRVTKEDVEAAAASPAARPAAVAEGPAAGEVIPMTGMRRVIAQRMHASLREMAQLTMAMEVLMDEAAKLRTQLAAEWEVEGIRPSYTDLIIRAVAKALRVHPLLNAEVTDQGIELRRAIHVGMAVALDHGLVVPVIRDADALVLHDLAAETTRLAEAARTGRLGLDDYAGGTFSVTSLGMGDVDFFTPIVNPPNVAILGVGRIRDGVQWDGDRAVRCRQLTLSLTVDHRAVDGVPGAAFLRTVRDLLQAPYRLLV